MKIMNEDVKGRKFGKLTAIEFAGKGKRGESLWLCQCDCEKLTLKVFRLQTLKNGRVKSCGCIGTNNTHNLSKHKLFAIHNGMKQRCFNESNHAYHHYGGRGITVSDEWLGQDDGFINFYEWSMKNGYKEGLSIDRVDVNGNYEPSNCKWATTKEQSINRRTSHYVEINGVTKNISEWAKENGLNPSLISHRLKIGLTGLDLLLPSGAVPKVPSNTRKVLQLSLDGAFLKEYVSGMDAVRQNNGLTSGDLSRACRGVYETLKGYIWKFKDEYEKGMKNE